MLPRLFTGSKTLVADKLSGSVYGREAEYNRPIVPHSTSVLDLCIVGIVTGAIVVLLVGILFAGELWSSKKIVVVIYGPGLGIDTSGRVGTLTARQIYEQFAPGVVSVKASGVLPQSPTEYFKGEGGGEGTTTGSGFEIDSNGIILTSWHVVEHANRIKVGLGRGKVLTAQIVGENPSDDVAVLRILADGLTLHPLVLGDSSRVQVGEPVLAIGDPFGLGRTLTTGIVSATKREIQTPSGMVLQNLLQTEAAINPGSAGGPLLNTAGEVLGINSEIETDGSNGGNVGIGFAIPIEMAERELSMLKKS